ncbi:MAG: type II toxin-antitoxin system RelE/ParE family toxin [Hyphomicrobiales bacterium]|nr:type II toxin-antitoxin system RelE/ParE family toxin [Hyphomicrobiales bacterium]
MTDGPPWHVELDAGAADDLRQLGATDRQHVLSYLRTRLATPDDPRRFGKALTGDLKGLWRYRIGDIRMIVSIKDETVTVLVLRVAHQREVYG